MDAGVRVKIGKVLATSVAVAASLAVLTPGAAVANGVGDLYVASPSGILEVHVASSSVVSTIPLSPSPQSLAFSPDGLTLYASNAGTNVTPVDIVTLNVKTSVSMPGPVSSLAFPSGRILVAAMPQRRTLAFYSVGGGTVSESAQLPGPGNLLAGDRREPRVAVAEAGANWLEVVDPGTETMRKATVPGAIVALAIDRGQGAALVATRNPNAVLLVDLTSLATTWTVDLPASPVGVAAMASTIVVAGGTTLWAVDGHTATTLATTAQAIETLTPSDEGSVIHVAEASNVEVFDAAGELQRTLALSGDQAPVALAAVPRGSSLYLGHGAGPSPSASPGGQAAVATSAPLATAKPPVTSTVVQTAVGLAILFLCWLFIRWYDRKTVRAR